jgi:hypothetical protein
MNTNSNTYIKNVGITKTLINNNNETYANEMKWEGDYNGEIAKFNLDINDNGKKDYIHMELNNDDLLNILNTKSVNTPIHERLKNDYLFNKQYKSLNKKYKSKSKSIKKKRFVKSKNNKYKNKYTRKR